MTLFVSVRQHLRLWLLLSCAIALVGYPHRTARAELSIVATKLPEVLSRCLHPFPEVLLNSQLKIKNKHVDLLVNRESAHTLRLRSLIVQQIRVFLLKRKFTEVETPILADGTGGAIARAFKTSASEFPERELSMRIAPELWLKRLVMGGFDRIFEIGRCFRNEGKPPTPPGIYPLKNNTNLHQASTQRTTPSSRPANSTWPTPSSAN